MNNTTITRGSINSTSINNTAINSYISIVISYNNIVTVGIYGTSLNILSDLTDYYYWDFGDPNSDDNIYVINNQADLLKNIFHQYSNSGIYTIRLVEVRKDGSIIENTKDIKIT